MEPIISLRFKCFVIGIVATILFLVFRYMAKRYEANKDYRKYEVCIKLTETFARIAALLILVGILLFPFEGLLNAIGEAVNQ